MRSLTRAKGATGAGPLETVQEGYVDETSLSHMTRVAIESRSREAADWISSHMRGGRRYRPRPGRGLRRPQPAASQLLGDHAPFFKARGSGNGWTPTNACGADRAESTSPKSARSERKKSIPCVERRGTPPEIETRKRKWDLQEQERLRL